MILASDTSSALALILVALIGQIGILAGIVVPIVWSGRRHAKEANEAVNCKPADEPKISEVVDEIAVGMHEIRDDLKEVRTEQAALAVQFGEHLRTGK